MSANNANDVNAAASTEAPRETASHIADPFAAVFTAKTPPAEVIAVKQTRADAPRPAPPSVEQGVDRTDVPVATRAGEAIELPLPTRWEARLPTLDYCLTALAALPLRFSEHLMDGLAASLHQHLRVRASIKLYDTREVIAVTPANQRPRLFIALTTAAGDAPLAIEIDSALAGTIIERIFDTEEEADAEEQDGARPSAADDESLASVSRVTAMLRPLSAGALAVLEFMCLVCVDELNAAYQAPLFKLEAVTPEIPAWLSAPAAGTRRLVTTIGCRLDLNTPDAPAVRNAIARVYCSTQALEALRHAPIDNPQYERQIALARYRQIAPKVSARLALGETEVAYGDLLDLAIDDVVILNYPRNLSDLQERLRLRLGDGDNFFLEGRLHASGDNSHELKRSHNGGAAKTGDEAETTTRQEAAANDSQLKIMIERIDLSDAPSQGDRLAMPNEFAGHTEAPDEASAPHAAAAATPPNSAATPIDAATSSETAAAAAVEKREDADEALPLGALLLTLRVELAARRLSLDELARLRAGQVLALGCQATDPVDLLVDGRRIARGELIELEGRLGVRILDIAALRTDVDSNARPQAQTGYQQ